MKDKISCVLIVIALISLPVSVTVYCLWVEHTQGITYETDTKADENTRRVVRQIVLRNNINSLGRY